VCTYGILPPFLRNSVETTIRYPNTLSQIHFSRPRDSNSSTKTETQVADKACNQRKARSQAALGDQTNMFSSNSTEYATGTEIFHKGDFSSASTLNIRPEDTSWTKTLQGDLASAWSWDKQLFCPQVRFTTCWPEPCWGWHLRTWPGTTSSSPPWSPCAESQHGTCTSCGAQHGSQHARARRRSPFHRCLLMDHTCTIHKISLSGSGDNTSN